MQSKEEIQNFFSFSYAETINKNLTSNSKSHNESELIQNAAANLYDQNKVKNFVPYMIQNVGVPVWTRSIVDESNQSFSIPFIDNDNNFTTGLLIGKANGENFDFALFERRFLPEGKEISEDDLVKIRFFVTHDNDLFENSDTKLNDILASKNTVLSSNPTQFRGHNTVVEICGCVYICCAAQDSEISTQTRMDCPYSHFWQCNLFNVWIPCDGDDTGTGGTGTGGTGTGGTGTGGTGTGGGTCTGCGHPPVIVGGGNGGPLNPPFVNEILLLQNVCLFGDEDNDTDQDSGAGNPLDAETEQLCANWNRYKEKCLGEDFAGLDLLNEPIFLQSGYGNHPSYIWGELLSTNPTLFNQLISGGECVTTDELSEEEECFNAMAEFQFQFGIMLTEAQQNAIESSNPPCDNLNEYFETACSALLNNEKDKLLETFEFSCEIDNPEELIDNEINNACPPTSGTNPVENFYENLGDILNPTIDWVNSSDQEKIDFFLKRLRWFNWQSQCGGHVNDFQPVDHITNPPGWTPNSTFFGNACGKELDTEITFSYSGGGSCNSCINFVSCGYTIVPGSNTARFNFSSCSGDCNSTVPCISFYVPADNAENFDDTYFKYCD